MKFIGCHLKNLNYRFSLLKKWFKMQIIVKYILFYKAYQIYVHIYIL